MLPRSLLINCALPGVFVGSLVNNANWFQRVCSKARKIRCKIPSHQLLGLERNLIFFTGVGVLLLVPVFKMITHLPPFMGILIGLGVMWIVTELIHRRKEEVERKNYTVAYALRMIDTPSILFFLGILPAISALDAATQLTQVAPVDE